MKKYNEISAYVSKNTFPWINTLVRKDAFPVDVYSIYNSLSAASQYSLLSVAAYEGQLIAVNENGKQVVYVLDSSDDVSSTGLRRVGVLSATELCGIGDYAKTSDFNGKLGLSSLSDISGDFGNKVFILNPGTTLSGVESDISVIKIPIEDFNRKTANSELIDNVLYIVSSDYIEGYGRQLCNIAMNEDEDVEKSFLGIAATDKYVKSEINLSVGSLSCDDKLSTNAGFIISSLSQANGKIEYGIRQLSIDELGNTDGKLALSSLSDISGGFGNKVFITNPGTSLSGVESDLSVVKITVDEFMRKSTYETLQNNTLYVVSSDYIEAYGQQISNVTMNNDDDPESSFLGMVATDSFVNCKLKDIKNHPDLSSFFGNDNGDIDLQQTVSVIKYILSAFGVR